MTHFRTLRPVTRLYVTSVVIAGTLVIAHSLALLYRQPISNQWFVLAALTLLTGSFTVRIETIGASLSVSETFVFVSVLMFGAAAGSITVLLECLIVLFQLKPEKTSIHKLLFNTAAPAIAIWVSGTAFFWASGFEPLSIATQPVDLPALVLPLACFTALYFLLNSWLVAVALGFEKQQSPVEIWWNNFVWLSVNYFIGASVAAIVVTQLHQIDKTTVAIVAAFLVVFYLTYRATKGRVEEEHKRVEEAHKHLDEMNSLFLSAVKTLATAIDAKDEVTHGHIQRVQEHTLGLARRMGVADKNLLKAIEAAALLHDVGKLAVPEYILHKPGKLTAAEFEKMKVHATAGADILSAIPFPYPVVPIVRHHHENWDGTGYPDGIKGAEIPIGARILSVVDCFDALTSDRPYRPRLPDSEAIRILRDRRGTMYDPLVVDTFIKVHDELSPEPVPTALPSQALQEITSARHPQRDATRFKEIASSSDEMITLYELARELGGGQSVSGTGDVITKHLRRLIPFSQSVLFVYDVATDEIVAEHAMGEAAQFLKGTRLKLGERLSGWVGANRQTIANSDPALDFGDVARGLDPPLRSCLSTPLLSGDEFVGVLTLYSPTMEGFTENHRRVIEAAGRQVANTFKGAAEAGRPLRPDPVTEPPPLTMHDRAKSSVH